jgi:hypothetical protein
MHQKYTRVTQIMAELTPERFLEKSRELGEPAISHKHFWNLRPQVESRNIGAEDRVGHGLAHDDILRGDVDGNVVTWTLTGGARS